MPLWMWLLDSLAIIVALLVFLVISIVVRRRWLMREPGAFEMSVNRNIEARSAQGWLVGIAAFRDNELVWFRVFSLSFRPKFRFARGQVSIEGRRNPQGTESYALHDGHIIVQTANPTPIEQLALSETSFTAVQSWLESSPPGRGLNTTF